MHHFTSDQFKWKGNQGFANRSDLLVNRDQSEIISSFTVTSNRTIQWRTYEIDTKDPGYEDGWDGEGIIYTDNLWDGTRITIFDI